MDASGRPASVTHLGDRYVLGERLPAGRAVEAYGGTAQDGRAVEVAFVETSDLDEALARFAAIAQVRHPRLAHILEWALIDGRCVLVSERPAGNDLGRLAGGEELPAPAELAAWGAQAAEALAALHERGLVHGGVSPVVLVVDENGDLTLTGAGLAAAAAPPELGDYDPPQNAYYVSPEEVLASQITPATDVYALGAALYRLATGRPAFTGRDALEVAQRHVDAAPVPPRSLRPALAPAFDHIILGALAKDPRRRPEARRLQGDLERAALGVRVAAPPSAGQPVPAPRRPWWPWVLGLALIALVAGLLLGSGALERHVDVPDVTGMTVDEAGAALGSAGLSTGSLSYRHDAGPGIVPGTVLAQTPAAGAAAARSSTVDLVVAGDILMPDLRGLPQASAESRAESLGLVVGQVTSAPSATVQAGYVLAQTPAAGSSVSAGIAVSLTVSSGTPGGPSPATSTTARPSPTSSPSPTPTLSPTP